MRADVILIVCLPEQIPYFKYRYGDSFLDHQYVKYSSNDYRKLKDIRAVPIYYISIPEKYFKKIDVESFNSICASSLFMKAVDDTFSVLSPTHFIFAPPYILISPLQWMVNNQNIHLRNFQDSIPLKNDYQSRFSFKADDEYLPNSAYTVIKSEDVFEIWERLQLMYKLLKKGEIKREEILMLSLSNLIDTYRDLGSTFSILKENVFDLREWKNYVSVLNMFEEYKDMEEMQVSRFFMTNYVKHLSNLTYHLSAPMINDDQYNINRGSIKTQNNEEFIKWKNHRKRLRGG